MDIEVEKAQILASVAEWEVQIAAAKQRLNEFAPVGRLPDELLVEIFLHQSSSWRAGDRSWTQVLRVCRRWHEVASRCLALWAQICATSFEWTVNMLSRSQQAALDVVIPDGSTPIINPIISLLAELPRTRSIDWNHYRFLHEATTPVNSAPFLCSVTLRCTSPVEYIPCPTPFDTLDMPFLTHVELVDIPVTWTSNMFSTTLTHLTYHLPHVRDRRLNQSFPRLLGILKSMTKLQFLELRNVLPEPSRTEDIQVRLPCLHSLNVYDEPLGTHFLLEHVSFPRDAHISITFPTSYPNHDQVARCVSSLTSTFASDPDSKRPVHRLQSLRVTQLGVEAWTMHQGVDVLSSHVTDSLASQSVPLIIQVATEGLPDPASASKSFSETVCRALPLSDVCSAFFDLEGFNSGHWHALQESMPNLRELGLFGPPSSHLWALNALAGSVDAPTNPINGSDQSCAAAFPKLEVLFLRNLQRMQHTPRNPNSSERDPVSRYCKVLRTRKNAGLLLSRIVIVETVLTQADVNELQSVAQEVVCDLDRVAPNASVDL
ncbi:F-box protein [Phanerochaete sordida]|uniref:F-box protein n=1 Tax=Phanerochaete sordida TaxID=48140 RepID=A0A9P3LAM0_9APHY|nr:F-box protein [Phanerochaete sordida]